jgi:sugar lactone lactonase YvrE
MKTPSFSRDVLSHSAFSFNPFQSFPPAKFNRSFLAAAGVVLLAPLAYGQATNLGSEPIGSTSTATAVTVTFTASATLGTINVLTQGASGLDFANASGGSCATGTGYNAADTCTVNVTLKPQAAGTRYGAVVLLDNSGNVIGSTYLQGSGSGPQTTFLPGTESSISSDLEFPEGVAADGSGNLFLADTSHNRILKETLFAGSYTESVVPTSPVVIPEWVAVDGAGNLYITDTGNSRVLKETLTTGGSYVESVLPTSALNDPFCAAVDGNGNVYVADYLNNRVLKETLSGSSYTESTITISDLNGPEALAVDSVGNVFFVDDSNRLVKMTLSGSTYSEGVIATSSLADPYGVTVDPNGNVYVSDSGNARILKETPTSGSTYSESTVTTSTLWVPMEVGVDAGGNVYIADLANSRVVKEDLADPPTLAFASTAQGSTSTDSPRTVTINNVGNSALNFSAVSFPTDFPENTPAPTDCTSSTVLAAASTCTLTIDFSPTAFLNGGNPALLTEGVSVTTNTLNVSTPQTVTVTGTETP